MRVVLDTNILFVSLSEHSSHHKIFNSLIQGKYTLLLSNDILEEYLEVIANKMDHETSENLSETLNHLASVEKIDVYYKWMLISSDVDDNKFVDAAIAGNADYLVTEDKDFNEVKKSDFPKVEVISLKEFEGILK